MNLDYNIDAGAVQIAWMAPVVFMQLYFYLCIVETLRNIVCKNDLFWE